MALKLEPEMWVKFTDDFEFRPAEGQGYSSIDYKKGWKGLVRRDCGDQAIAQGKAEEVPTPARAKDKPA